jgi:hypothetical protein
VYFRKPPLVNILLFIAEKKTTQNGITELRWRMVRNGKYFIGRMYSRIKNKMRP